MVANAKNPVGFGVQLKTLGQRLQNLILNRIFQHSISFLDKFLLLPIERTDNTLGGFLDGPDIKKQLAIEDRFLLFLARVSDKCEIVLDCFLLVCPFDYLADVDSLVFSELFLDEILDKGLFVEEQKYFRDGAASWEDEELEIGAG